MERYPHKEITERGKGPVWLRKLLHKRRLEEKCIAQMPSQ